VLIQICFSVDQERQNKGEREREVMVGELLAYKGRFKDAARAFQRCNQEHKALAMYTDLRMFDLAQVTVCTFFFNFVFDDNGILLLDSSL
jgi:hypothetical protein